jgi:hypothetical protein
MKLYNYVTIVTNLRVSYQTFSISEESINCSRNMIHHNVGITKHCTVVKLYNRLQI